MAEEKKIPFCCQGKKDGKGVGTSSGVYGLGIIGALVYYLQHAGSFTDGAIGVFKAIFWPAFAVYKLIEVWQF